MRATIALASGWPGATRTVMAPPRQYCSGTFTIDAIDRRRRRARVSATTSAGPSACRARRCRSGCGSGRSSRAGSRARPPSPGRRGAGIAAARPGDRESRPAAFSDCRSGCVVAARQLDGGEPEHAADVAAVAGAAVLLRRRVVHRPVDVLLPVRREDGVGLVGVPDERAHPVVLRAGAVALDEARLEQHPVQRELLPELRPDREHPVVHVGRVDLRARRQADPAPLRGAVGPELVASGSNSDRRRVDASATRSRRRGRSPTGAGSSGADRAPAGRRRRPLTRRPRRRRGVHDRDGRVRSDRRVVRRRRAAAATERQQRDGGAVSRASRRP